MPFERNRFVNKKVKKYIFLSVIDILSVEEARISLDLLIATCCNLFEIELYQSSAASETASVNTLLIDSFPFDAFAFFVLSYRFSS